MTVPILYNRIYWLKTKLYVKLMHESHKSASNICIGCYYQGLKKIIFAL